MRQLSLAKRFLLGSLVILIAGMTGIGLWVTRQIEDGVVHRSASTTAVYVDSLIAGSLQDLADGDALSADSAAQLDWLLTATPLGQQVAVFRVWDRQGQVVYSSIPEPIGEQVSADEDLTTALSGQVTAHIGDIEGEVPASQRPPGELLEIYSPVRRTGNDEVIAVAEFYYGTAELKNDLAGAQRRSWLVVAGGTVLIYLLLAAFVQRASNTIVSQQRALRGQVTRLTDLLRQNAELHERVQGAATRTTALNERFLRRFASELHDGPAQDISFALLQLDNVQARVSGDGVSDDETERDLAAIQVSLKRALEEVRATSTGLALPQLGNLTIAETVEHAVRAHRRRTGSQVAVAVGDLPARADVAVKIAIYRVIQEGLANAWRHAGGVGQAVRVERTGPSLLIEVSDQGPGFDAGIVPAGEHLGLVGMRERVTSLGGDFSVTSGNGTGTRVRAVLPFAAEDEQGE
ncbi:MAG TPA: sensor histidine kinase [Thermomicrobiales bacterium]|nr:sensor histidine kinase [Thermomicrobiales bacterium]